MTDIRYVLEEDVVTCHEQLKAVGSRADRILSTSVCLVSDSFDPLLQYS